MLACGEASAANAIDENLDALPVMPAAQPHMVRRPLVAEGGGDGGMNLKGRVGEGEAKLRERARPFVAAVRHGDEVRDGEVARSEEHTSELQSLMRISYAVFCLK